MADNKTVWETSGIISAQELYQTESNKGWLAQQRDGGLSWWSTKLFSKNLEVLYCI